MNIFLSITITGFLFCSLHAHAGISDTAKNYCLSENKIDVAYEPATSSYIERFKQKGTTVYRYISNTLLSTENQFRIEAWYNCLLFSLGIISLLRLLRDRTQIDSSVMPSPVRAAASKMNFPVNAVYQSEILGDNACAMPLGSITIGTELLNSCTPQEIEFVVGHEITHVQNKHAIKSLVTFTAILVARAYLPSFIERLIKSLKNNSSATNSPIKQKLIIVLEKINTMYTNNPLIGFLMQKIVMSKLSRLYEMDADITSAQKTGQAAGGISFFNKFIQKNIDNDQSRNCLHYLDALNLLSAIEKTLFPTHPQAQERIAYLEPLIAS